MHTYVHTQDADHDILSKARSQISSFLIDRPLYVLTKKFCINKQSSQYEDHWDTFAVQRKVKDSLCLETHCGTWNRLMLGSHPGQLSFILRAACYVLPTAMKLKHRHIHCSAKYS